MITPMCKHCGGWTTIVIGVLFVLNHFFDWFGWGLFVGFLLVLWGLVGLFVPNKCKACAALQNPQTATAGKKRK